MILLLFTLIFSQPVFAEDQLVIEVQPLKPQIDVSEFASPHYRVHPFAESGTKVADQKIRNRAIMAAGLQEEVKSFDALDRDVLFMRAQNLSLERLRGDYPHLNSDSLKKLQESVHAEKAE